MDKLDLGDFLDWKNDRITQLFFSHLRDRRAFHEENLLADADDDIHSLKKNIARINLLNDILAIELEDLTP